MIKKLKKKFILINMGLICLVMLIVFASICLFSYQWQKSESIKVMERVLNNDSSKDSPPFEIRERDPYKAELLIPVFSVLVNEQGDIISLAKENVTVSDEVVEQVIQESIKSGNPDGVLLNMQLRFLTKETPEGLKIAFADIGREIDTMKKLIISLALVGLGGLLGFFFISLFLSGWILRPVERAWQQQRQFVADASHELKTPITVILANIGILLAHKKDPIEQHAKWLENTNAEALRMKKLVEDLLFLAKSDAAQEELTNKTQLQFSDILWSCILPFEPLAYEQGISLDSHIEKTPPYYGDESQLKQLIVILLDNACKYSEKGGTIHIRLKSESDALKLAVTNFGEPIEKEHLENIFERFYCVDNSRALDKGGYGLGLSIAKTIVQNHSGAISVTSGRDSGTTFTVTLPLK